MQRHQKFAAVLAITALSGLGLVANRSRPSASSLLEDEDRRALRSLDGQFSDPKTVELRPQAQGLWAATTTAATDGFGRDSNIDNNAMDMRPPTGGDFPYQKTATLSAKSSVTVTIYLTKERRDLRFDDNFNEAFSIFHTDTLQRYGTGSVRYIIEEKAECDDRCDINNVFPDGGAKNDEPCLAVSRHAPRMLCNIDLLKCNYPRCKTMVSNDEFCTKIDLPFDSRQYYTSERPELGYVPIGPRLDSWQSFRKIQSTVGYVLAPSSRRRFAFNAIFSRSTNTDRKNLASDIEGRSETSDLPIYTAMAETWNRDANDAESDQLSTDEYMGVVLDSVFTLSPAGHSPECFRLFEAVEAGSIPVTTRDDLHGTYHPDRGKNRKFKDLPHPCKDSLHHWYNAPIVVLDSWGDLYPTMELLMSDPAKLDQMQSVLRGWYDAYMRQVVAEFEAFVLKPSQNINVA